MYKESCFFGMVLLFQKWDIYDQCIKSMQVKTHPLYDTVLFYTCSVHVSGLPVLSCYNFFLFRILSISWSYSSQLWLLYLIRLWNQQSSKFHAGISLSIAMNGFWNVPLGFPSRTSLWKENESFPLNEKVLRHGRKKRKTKGARQVWSHSISFHAHVDWR